MIEFINFETYFLLFSVQAMLDLYTEFSENMPYQNECWMKDWQRLF